MFNFNLKGVAEYFIMGKKGPMIKKDADKIQFRNNADDAYINIQALDPVDPQDMVTLQYFQANSSNLPFNTDSTLHSIIDFNSATQQIGITDIPKKALVYQIQVEVKEPWDDVSATLDIGESTTNNRLMNQNQVCLDVAGLYVIETSDIFCAQDTINAYLSNGTSTQGSAEVTILYTISEEVPVGGAPYLFDILNEDDASVYADAKPAIEDPTGRDGWYYKSSGSDKVNWYFHDGQTNPVTVGEFNGLYTVATVDSSSNDTFHLAYYTFPLGDGQDAGSWYRSRIVYVPSGNFARGVKTLFYMGQKPDSCLYPDLPRVQMTVTSVSGSSVGLNEDTEVIFTSVFGTNSGASAGTVELLVNKLGFNSSVYNMEYSLEIKESEEVPDGGTPSLLIEQTAWTNSYSMANPDVNSLNLGQTFTVTNDTELTSIALLMTRTGVVSDMQLEIYDDVIVNATNANGAVLIGASDVYDTSLLNNIAFEEFEFQFSNTVTLTANTTYYFRFKYVNPVTVDNGQYVKINYTTNSNAYLGGLKYTDNLPANLNDGDLYFKVYGIETISSNIVLEQQLVGLTTGSLNGFVRGQTFQHASQFNIDEIVLSLLRVNSPTGNATIKVYQSPSKVVLLGTSDPVDVSTFNTAFNDVSFNFSTPVNGLLSNTSYYFELDLTSVTQDVSNNLGLKVTNFSLDGGANYDNGASYLNGNLQAVLDLYFIIKGTEV